MRLFGRSSWLKNKLKEICIFKAKSFIKRRLFNNRGLFDS